MKGKYIQLCKIRNHQATYMFMNRLVKAFGELTVLTTEKDPALLCVFEKLKHNSFYVHTKHCTVKHFNNLIEQDHRYISSDVLLNPQDFKIFIMLHVQSKESKPFMLYKRKRSQIPDFSFSTELSYLSENKGQIRYRLSAEYDLHCTMQIIHTFL
ncbi:DDE-type integrase/transposase/recombinase [Bacillus thuringiensis]